eukprot:1315993-Amorphochlora_amoeboformis.AAC.2
MALLLLAIGSLAEWKDPVNNLEIVALNSTKCVVHRYTKEFLEGGITNVMERLYSMATTAASNGKTVLLPHIRNTPCLVNQGHGSLRSQWIPLSQVFDRNSYCQILAKEGVCYQCSSIPREFEHEREDYTKEVLSYNESCNKDHPDVPVPWKQRCFKKSITSVGMSGFKPKNHRTTLRYSKNYFEFAAQLKPSAKVEHAIKTIISKLGSKPFIAVHMRIEIDWQLLRGGKCYIHPKDIVHSITSSNKFQELHRNGTQIALFTASGEKDKAHMAWKHVKGIQVITTDEETSGFNWQQKSLVDQELCRRSDVFVGAMVMSTFSQMITYLRKSDGAKDNYGYTKKHNKAKFGSWDEIPFFHCFT